MRRPRRGSRRTVVSLAVAAVVLLELLAASTPHSVSAGSPLATEAAAVPLPGISATVTWGGANIVSASSVSSALPTTFTHTINVVFQWVSRAGLNGPDLYNVSTARIQFFYFGAALDTRDVVDSSPLAATNGSFDLQWQPGVFQWLFEGTFGLAALLIAPNGTTMWSQAFYIHAQAPYAIAAVLPVLLVLIAVYEAYGLATSGRADAAAGPSAAKGPPKKPSPPEAAEEDPETEPGGGPL